MALPKKYRLKKSTDINRLKKEGKLFSHPYLGVLVLENKKIDLPLFGFIISTKVAKNASKRFKLKRQLSEIVYELLPVLKDGFEIVFLPKKALFDQPFLEIKKAVGEVFDKAKLLKR